MTRIAVNSSDPSKKFDMSGHCGKLKQLMKQKVFPEVVQHIQHPQSKTGKGIVGISLFSGAGGMDVGFEKAGVSVVKASEIMPAACETYRANHPNCDLLEGDVNEYMDAFAPREADIVFGGPPCQGFSVAGKMNPDDKRSQLIWSFLDVVERVQPKVFIMENVKALATLEKWGEVRRKYLERAQEMGYFCHYFVLNSADFGVCQKRERVFFIGAKTDFSPDDFQHTLNRYHKRPQTLRQLLLSLPSIGEKGNENTCTAKISCAAKPVMRRSPYAGMLFNGMGRPLNLDSISSTLPASMGGNKTPIVDERLLQDETALDWVKDYHSRLWNEEIVPTFCEAPSFLRRISIAEAAAIQSFPAEYVFCGQKSSVYTQIGNAVPCQLAEAVAKSAIKFFNL